MAYAKFMTPKLKQEFENSEKQVEKPVRKTKSVDIPSRISDPPCDTEEHEHEESPTEGV